MWKLSLKDVIWSQKIQHTPSVIKLFVIQYYKEKRIIIQF